MIDIVGLVIKSISMFLDHSASLRKLELEKEKLQKDYQLESQRISVCKEVALANIEKEKLALTRNLEICARELDALAISKEILYRAIEKLVEKIISDKSDGDKQIYLQAIDIVREEISKLREESSLHFQRISVVVQKAMENPIEMNFLEGGD